HGRERPPPELLPDAVAVRIRGIVSLADHLGRGAREQDVALDADVDLERLGGEVREARERALPAERLHYEIRVDAADARRVDLAPGRRAEHAEVDALADQPGLPGGAAARGGAQEVGALLLELAGHLVRQRLDDAEAHQGGWVALVTARRVLAVAVEERVVGLGAGAIRTAEPVARGTRDGFRAAEQPAVHATERPGRRLGRLTTAETVGKVVLVLEEQLPEIRELRQTDLARCYPLRIELGVPRPHEEARLRGLPHAELLPSSGPPLRLARRLQAERLGASRRGAIRAPRRDVLARRAPAPGDRESHAAEGRRARRRSARHGTESLGSRAREGRSTRML